MTMSMLASVLTLTNLCGSVSVDMSGGRVVSYVPAGGEEVLAQLEDGSGGVALCWPWFANDGPKRCRRHGVARYHDFVETSRTESPYVSELRLRLRSDGETRQAFPHDFDLTLVVRLEKQLTLRLIGENTGKESFSVTEMIHPYFRVGDARQCVVRGLDGLSFRDNVHPELGDARIWHGDCAVADGSKVFSFGRPDGLHMFELEDPVLDRTLTFTSSNDLKTVVWSPGEASGKGSNVTSKLAPGEWKRFVCVENGTCYGNQAYELKPGERHELVRTIGVRPGRSLRDELARKVLDRDYAFSTWSAVYNRVFDQDAAADDAWRGLRTVEAYDKHRLTLRSRMIRLIGGFPERTPLNPRVTGQLVRDGYRVEKILFESRPGMYVTGLLYLPDAAAFAPPYKAALEVCGHSYEGKGQRKYRRVAVLAAKAGLAALVIDPFAQGERAQCPEDLDGRTTASHLRLGVNAMLLGHGLAAFEMWDAIRALDYLDTREDVRHDGYGVMGNSGGGTQSVFLSGLDERIVATATSSFLSNLREQTAWRLLADSEQIVFAQLPNGINHAAHPLMGGNPVLMLSRRDELIPFTGTRETARLLMEVGRNLGVPDRYGMYDLPGPHGYNELNMRRSAAYLVQHLTGRDVVWTEGDADAGPEGPDRFVTPTGRVMDLEGFRSAYDFLADELAAAERSRKRLSSDERAALVRKQADIDDARVGQRQVLSERQTGEVRVVRGFYQTTEDERLPFVEFVPADMRGTPVVCVADTGRTNHIARLERELAAGSPVVSVDISATGEIGGTRHHYVNPHDDEEVAKMLYILGSSLVGRRAGDVIAIARDVCRRFGVSPRVAAVGRAGVAAAHAFAAEPGLISSVTIENAPLSWAESVRKRTFYDYAASVQGGLLHYDWVDLVSGNFVQLGG